MATTKRKRRVPRSLGDVVALPGAAHPGDAIKWIAQEVSKANPPKGVITVLVNGRGDIDVRAFGHVTYNAVARAAAVLMLEAAKGD